MHAEFLLTQLVKVSRKMRSAQKEYYRTKKDDPLKASYLLEAQRREQDLDKLLIQIDKVHHIPIED